MGKLGNAFYACLVLEWGIFSRLVGEALPAWGLSCGGGQNQLFHGHALLYFSPRRSLRAGADVNASSVKKNKNKEKTTFVFILKALFQEALLGFALGGVKCHRCILQLEAFLTWTRGPRRHFQTLSNLRRSLPKRVFPPVGNSVFISVK